MIEECNPVVQPAGLHPVIVIHSPDQLEYNFAFKYKLELELKQPINIIRYEFTEMNCHHFE
uniref:Uncharacterized protein n=1 Tax=Onchocerca volvulus TaxID=6282 RepID=A0A8R1XU22_ONCVO